MDVGRTCLSEWWFSWDIGPGVGMSDHGLPSLEILFSGMRTNKLSSAVANVHANDHVGGFALLAVARINCL